MAGSQASGLSISKCTCGQFLEAFGKKGGFCTLRLGGMCASPPSDGNRSPLVTHSHLVLMAGHPIVPCSCKPRIAYPNKEKKRRLECTKDVSVA